MRPGSVVADSSSSDEEEEEDEGAVEVLKEETAARMERAQWRDVQVAGAVQPGML